MVCGWTASGENAGRGCERDRRRLQINWIPSQLNCSFSGKIKKSSWITLGLFGVASCYSVLFGVKVICYKELSPEQLQPDGYGELLCCKLRGLCVDDVIKVKSWKCKLVRGSTTKCSLEAPQSVHVVGFAQKWRHNGYNMQMQANQKQKIQVQIKNTHKVCIPNEKVHATSSALQPRVHFCIPPTRLRATAQSLRLSVINSEASRWNTCELSRDDVPYCVVRSDVDSGTFAVASWCWTKRNVWLKFSAELSREKYANAILILVLF